MKRQGVAVFTAFLILLWAALAAVLLAKGGFYIANHEGDTMHLIDIVLRMANGEWPHLDFMSPIGWLAAAPMSLFVSLGHGVGTAMLAGQVLFGLLLIPAIWWVGASRLQTVWAMLFGAICLWLTMALVYGTSNPSMSVSMHYNRWAWALAFVAIAVAMLPPVARRSAIADGVVLGLCLAGLALIKVTYFVAFMPPILIVLLSEREWRTLKAALISGFSVVLVLTLLAGPRFWFAYLGDLLTVIREADRAYPGHSLDGVIIAPAYLAGSLVLILSVLLLRKAGRSREGLLLLLLTPGFFYVTFQNFGNDPQWLYLLGLLLIVLRPEADLGEASGRNMRQALTFTAFAAFMLAVPSAINLVFSPFRHLAVDTAGYSPMLPALEQHADIQISRERNIWPKGVMERHLMGGKPEADPESAAKIAVLKGEVLPGCEIDNGTVTFFDAMAREIEHAGFAGAAIYPTDLLSGIWLFGDFKRVHGAAPWRYSGLPGIENADHLLVPLCPVLLKSRAQMLALVEAEGFQLNEVLRGDDYILLEIQRP